MLLVCCRGNLYGLAGRVGLVWGTVFGGFVPAAVSNGAGLDRGLYNGIFGVGPRRGESGPKLTSSFVIPTDILLD